MENELSAKVKPLLVFTNKSIRVEYDENLGMLNFYWDDVKKIQQAYSSVRVSNRLRSKDYPCHRISVITISDQFGTGQKITITNTGDGLPTMRQNIFLYEDKPYLLIDVELESSSGVSANDMTPIEVYDAGGVNIGNGTDLRMLYVPFDNDVWVRYSSNSVNCNMTSYEVTAFYDNSTRNGLVMGSITHDFWKTGIVMSGSGNKLNSLKIYGGITSFDTRDWDSSEHGSMSGNLIKSPLIFIGYYNDWRDGMEEYANANAVIEKPLGFNGGVPFGWNSWAAYADKVTNDDYKYASDFIKSSLQNKGFQNNDIVYINWDAFWTKYSDDELQSCANYVKNNGQKPGIYFTPVAHFGNTTENPNEYVPGTNNAYTIKDILLKDDNGRILSPLDGGFSLDPTHPGTKMRIDYYFDKFKGWGYEFLKMDFMAHGIREGNFYDTSVKTGVQAYNKIMQYINSKVDTDNFLLSLSIAPLFPHQYAHARRMTCDTFGGINDSEYGANAITYGWWVDTNLYRFNDPDHICLNCGDAEARTRFNLSVISGTLLLDSDDFRDATIQDRAKRYLTNKEVNDLAKKDRAFRPIESNIGVKAGETFILKDDTTYYLAVFNFDSIKEKTVIIDLERAGLCASPRYLTKDLWSGEISEVYKTFSIKLESKQSTIIKLSSYC